MERERVQIDVERVGMKVQLPSVPLRVGSTETPRKAETILVETPPEKEKKLPLLGRFLARLMPHS